MSNLSHLNALRALEATVRGGSFRAAAAELGVTPAAVGQQVRALEEALGQRLLVRRANRLEMTDVAVLAGRKLTDGFDILREAMALMTPSRVQHRLSISVVPTIAERWLTPRLSGFLAEHPEIDLRIDSTPHFIDMADSEFDFALRYAPPVEGPLEYTDLFGEILMPVCAAGVAARLGPVDDKGALSNAPLLHVETETSDTLWLDWQGWGQRFGYEVPRAARGLQFTHTTLALRSVFDGHGLFLGQLSILSPDLQAGRLVAPFGPSRTATTGFSYRLIFTGAGTKTPLQRAFVSWIEREAKQTEAEMAAYLAA